MGIHVPLPACWSPPHAPPPPPQWACELSETRVSGAQDIAHAWTHHGHPHGAVESVELREAKRLRALQALSTTWIRVVVVAMVVSPVNVRSEPTQSRQNSFGDAVDVLQPWAGGACPAGATDVVVSAGESVVASSLELCSGGGQTELLMLGELAVTPAAPGPAPTAPPSPPPPSPPPPHAPPPFGSATPEQRGNEISAVMVAGIGISSLVGAIVLAIALRVVLKRCKESAAQSHRTMIEESGMDHVDDLVEEPALSDVKAVVDESALSHVNTL